MGTFLKYLFYIALIIVIYLVGKGVYEGQINEKTTVGEVVSDVASGTKDIVRSGVNAAGDAVDDASDKAEEAADKAKVAADNYQKAPKEDVRIPE